MDSKSGNVCFCTSNELRAPKYGGHDHWEYKPSSRGTPYYYQHNNPDIWCLRPVAPKEKRRSYILIQPGSHRLIFKAYTAKFCIAYSSSVFLKASGSNPFPFGIIDRDGFLAGKIHVPLQLIEVLKGKYQEFICLSRRRYNQLDHGSAPQLPEDDFKSTSDQVTLYPNKDSAAAKDDDFDHRRYNRYKPWPLYNIMMIGWDNGAASRIAVGILHVTAFWQAKPVKKTITLAWIFSPLFDWDSTQSPNHRKKKSQKWKSKRRNPFGPRLTQQCH